MIAQSVGQFSIRLIAIKWVQRILKFRIRAETAYSVFNYSSKFCALLSVCSMSACRNFRFIFHVDVWVFWNSWRRSDMKWWVEGNRNTIRNIWATEDNIRCCFFVLEKFPYFYKSLTSGIKQLILENVTMIGNYNVDCDPARDARKV